MARNPVSKEGDLIFCYVEGEPFGQNKTSFDTLTADEVMFLKLFQDHNRWRVKGDIIDSTTSSYRLETQDQGNGTLHSCLSN